MSRRGKDFAAGVYIGLLPDQWRQPMRYLRTLLLFLGLTLAAAAHADLRTYEVDARYRQELFSALKAVLNPNEQVANGRISMLPTGQLLIDASPEVHEQVAAVLESVRSFSAEATPRVTLRYWAVLGIRESAPDLGVGRPGTEVPEFLSGVLDELRRVHGDLAFHLSGNATLVSESGQPAEIGGEPLNIRQLAYVQPSALNVELRIRFIYRVPAADGRGIIANLQQGVELHTSLEPNEFVVVGENTIRSSDYVPDGIDGTVFFIVQWDAPE